MTSIDTAQNLRRAKRGIENAVAAVSTFLSSPLLDGARENPAWGDLYYTHPALNQEPTYLRRAAALRPFVPSSCVGQFDELLALVRAEFATAREAKRADDEAKASRQARRSESAAQKRYLGTKLPPLAKRETFQVLRVSLSEVEARVRESIFRGMVAKASQRTSSVPEDTIARQAALLAEDMIAAFAGKLAGKVDGAKKPGDVVTDAVCVANMNPGAWSVLTISGKSADGSAFKQVWETKTIINRSVYDRYFNQWPTRRVDA